MTEQKTPGVILTTDFRLAKEVTAEGKKYSEYALGYIGRDEAHEGKDKEYGYMGNPEKTDGVFGIDSDKLSKYEQANYADVFNTSQKKDCPIYRPILSFDNKFLTENGIDYHSDDGIKKIKEFSRLGISELIHNSHLRDDNVIWTAAIHYNTDNIHVHFALVEKEKVERKKDMIEQKAIDKSKSRVANYIVDDLDLKKELSDIFQIQLPKEIKETVKQTRDKIDEMMNVLPENVPLQYNRSGMEPYREYINNCVDVIVSSDSKLSSKYRYGRNLIEVYERDIRRKYGDGKFVKTYDEETKTWAVSDKRTRGLADKAGENKLKDFYSRAGNALLSEVKACRVNPREKLSAIVPAAEPAGGKSTNDNYADSISLPEPHDTLPEDIGPAAIPFERKNNGPAGEKSEEKQKDNIDIDKIFESAERGNTYELYKLGRMYLDGKNAEKDEKKALSIISAAADMDNPYAAYQAAKMYQKGVGTDKSDFWADLYYTKAYKGYSENTSGSSDSQSKTYYKLGKMEQKGEGTANDVNAALKSFKESAYYGNDYAQYELYKIYRYGLTDINGGLVESNFETAFGFLCSAALCGNKYAMDEIAGLFATETDKEFKEASVYINIASELSQLNLKNQITNNILDKQYKHEDNAGLTVFIDSLKHKPEYFYVRWTDEYNRARDYLYGSNGIERDYGTAVKLYENQAASGNALAMYDLGKIYEAGLGVEASNEKSTEYYSKALNAFCAVESQKHDAYVQYRIGKMYAAGLGTNQDYEAAAKWYRLAVDQNNKLAMYSLAGLYYNGRGVKQDYEEAYHLYAASAEKGNVFGAYEAGKMSRAGIGTNQDENLSNKYFKQAFTGFKEIEEKTKDEKMQYRLGKMLETGLGCEQDISAAVEYYKLSSEMGDANAQYALAKIYINEGNADKIPKALQLLKRSSDNGNDFAMYALGCIYLDGKYNEKDIKSACEYLTAAALAENEYAQFKLGRLYLKGDEIGKDAETGIQLLSFSAEHGNQFAQYSLGQIYLLGEGITADSGKAVGYFKKSAEQNNPYAAYQLWRLYTGGKEVGLSRNAAGEYYKIALDGFVADEKGNPDATLQYRIGSMYYNGLGCEKDISKAVKYYKLSADNNNPYAAYQLGQLYSEGKEVELSRNAAGEYYKIALDGFVADEKENPDATLQYRIGSMYYNGLGCEKNVSKAVEYYTKSAKQGNQYAQYKLGVHYYFREHLKERGMMWIEKSAAQGNQYAKDTIYKVQHPHVYNNNITGSLRAVVSINRELRRLNRSYEYRVNQLEREFDYEQDYEDSLTNARSL